MTPFQIDEKCVMVVEDNDDLRMLYLQAMKLGGYGVVMASNGKEALELLRSSPTMPRVILLDLMMPIMDGWQFLKEQSLDDKLKDIPVVVCSASKENIPEGVKFLKKPIDLDSLLDVARTYCK